jgi:hypothetical protein
MRKLATVLVILTAIGVMAVAAPTTIDLNWDAGGIFNMWFFNGDDSNAKLHTEGNHIFGSFHGADADNNPYNYGVDNGTFQVMSSVENGGWMEYVVQRTDSKSSMYGPSGQLSYSMLGTSDGTASLAQSTSTNYASMKTCNYGFQANNQFMAAGTEYSISHSIQAGDGDWASIDIWGSGSASATYMSEVMGGTGFEFAYGNACGCYHNCSASGTGTGTFMLQASAANYLIGDGWEAPSGGTYLQQIVYGGGFSVDDPTIKGN